MMMGGGRARFDAHRWTGAVAIMVTTVMSLVGAPAAAQLSDELELSGNGGRTRTVPLAQHRGYPAVASAALETAGWTVAPQAQGYMASLPGGLTLSLFPGVPFIQVDTAWAQLVDAPYVIGDSLYVPLQLLTDVLPDRLPDLYASDSSRALTVREASLWGAGGGPAAADPEPEVPAPTEDDGVRVVIIDAGHGGVDPGSLGRTRTREKDITLAFARALARALEGDDRLEVHMTRDSDELIPLWERGQIASRMRGDRPGIFVSIHANAVTRSDVRGFETYFLSEARTDHEARVAALENSVMELERGRNRGPAQDELGVIIGELLNLDFQHWSSDLAAEIQTEVTAIHPGPDRGVKQGPLAVLTNAMMPSVLVELGFVSNPDEERTLQDPDFQEEVAQAMARAIRDFFRRYPPGSSTSTNWP